MSFSVKFSWFSTSYGHDDSGLLGSNERSSAVDAPIDLDHLRRYTMGETELEQEILALFVAQAPLMLGQLQNAGSQREWLSAAHTLKGSARAVGATRLGDLATAAESQDFAHRSQRDATLSALQEALAEAAAFIRGIRGDP